MNRNKGICELIAEKKNGRTVITDCCYTAPFKIMNPFYDGQQTTIMIMTASAGMLAGDDYLHRYQIRENADLTITGQGYTKVFNTRDYFCTNHVEMEVGELATLRYLPHPCIPYPGSDYRGKTIVRLKRSSTFVYMDILASGRVARQEHFQMKYYRNELQVYLDDQLVFLDLCVLRPDQVDYGTIGFWGEYTHTGMMYIYRPDGMEQLLTDIRNIGFFGRFGATLAKEGILVRAMGESGEEIENFFLEINQLIEPD